MVVTWVGPVPAKARVAYTDGEVFAAAAKAAGPEIPNDFPDKYTKDLREVELFNASMAWDLDEVARWQERYGIKLESGPATVFEEYLRTGHAIFETLVEHPTVPEPERFAACSVVLQRAVIVYADGQETLFLRSYFHSANDAGDFVNFVPRGGIEVSFATDVIWYPLALTQFIQEPASYVVLDIMTPGPLDATQLPESFRLDRSSRMTFQGTTYAVARVTGTVAAGQEVPDLRLKPPSAKAERAGASTPAA